MTKSPSRTRLVLDLRMTPDAAHADAIPALAAAGDVACALLPALDDAVLTPCVQSLQSAGIAALVSDDVAAAQRSGADGVFLSAADSGLAGYEAARDVLPQQAIVGAAAGDDRHLAMALGEAGADFLAFTLPDDRDALAWWAEIIEVPCVALGTIDRDEAQALAGLGVEFVAVPGDVTTVAALEAVLAVTELARTA